jgi:prevent-host-death family protein
MTRTEHMSVAEVKRRFADVVGMVVHGGVRVIVERRGTPVVAIVSTEEAGGTAGARLAQAFRAGGVEGERFATFMQDVVSEREQLVPRPVEM